jgi:cell division septation protein DedD
MHEDFKEDELQPAQSRRDTEVTLGPMMLLGVFFGLVLLCGLCFGLGYAVGHRPDSPAAAQPPAAGAQTQDASRPKPSAAPQNGAAPAVQNSSAGQVAASSQSSSTPAATGSPQTPPVVKPALPAAAIMPAQAAPAGTTMVQIAAVSHQEDADVLVEALRKRGYAVAVSRDAADGQFHVRIGPFASRNEAGAMRQKLLNDGYNAIVQP